MKKLQKLFPINLNNPISQIVLAFLVAFFLWSCAREASPTGGPKDDSAPVTHDSLANPQNYSLNFNSKTISIPFNEYVKVVDPFRNILISPPLEEKPEIRTKGKSIVVDLKNNKLRPNTTYTINFGEAIEDITEGNKALNLKYVFSTGNIIDSLIVRGKVVDAVTLLPEEKVAVMLYNSMDDSLPYKTIPNYYSLTNKEGEFEITNIHEGNYKAFALKDQNLSLTYDIPSEKIAFTDSVIVPYPENEDYFPLDLRLFKEVFQKQYISKNTLNYPGFIYLIFNQPPNKPILIPTRNSPNSIFQEISKNKDTIKYWMEELSKFDSLFYYVADGDSIIDTIAFETERELTKTKKEDTLTYVSNAKANFDLFDTLKLTFSEPIIEVDTTLISFLKDSLPIHFDYKIGGAANRTLKVWCPWEQLTYYSFKINPNSIKTLFNLKNDTIEESFKTQELAFYGNLILDAVLDSTNHSFILSLIDQGGKLIDERIIDGSQKITFPYLLPKKYTLKLLFDKNGNNRWDPGRYFEHIPPERILYFHEEITIQSGWDSEIQWITNEKLRKTTKEEIDSLKTDSIPKK